MTVVSQFLDVDEVTNLTYRKTTSYLYTILTKEQGKEQASNLTQ